ncbi:Clavaminate synthase-like protein [Xylariaceae sp. FL0804]|nr:Clavaminate synthase-like protein [Xylariaceae sp. FL0804]
MSSTMHPDQETKIPTVSASIPVLRLDHLRHGEKTETKCLLEACISYGFFYLDLSSDTQLLEDWDSILDQSMTYFSQPLHEKLKDALGSDSEGYEPVGTSAGADLSTVDDYESFKISETAMRKGNVKALASSGPDSDSDSILRYIRAARTITMMILSHLSDELGLRGEERFEQMNSEHESSLSTMAMFRYPKYDAMEPSSGIGHNKHTDLGTLTVLLTKQWGLQVLSPDSVSWAFIKPLPRHAIVNVGDSLRFLSGSRLASVVHRVLPVQETQHEDRYSIAYFLRMNDTAEFAVKGRRWSAAKWHDYKFGLFREPLATAGGLQDLTGDMETNDQLVVGHL